MNPEHYRSMTDDQIAEWHMLTNEVGNLKLKLYAAESLAAQWQEKYQSLVLEHAQTHADYSSGAEEQKTSTEQLRNRVRRAEEKLRVLAECVPDFLMDFIQTYEPFVDEALTPEAQEMRKNARELMVLLGQNPT